jgi:hypothetical protein
MKVVQGEGAYRYEITNDWRRSRRHGWREVGAVAVDDKDNVYVFNRGPHPMMVFDRAGNFLRSWGEGLFKRAHGAHYAPDGTLWLTDDGDHSCASAPSKQGAHDDRRARPSDAVT